MIMIGNNISQYILLKKVLAADTDTPKKSDKVE